MGELVCCDPDTGGVRRFLTGSRGCEISPDDEIIEFLCNENQQFRTRIKID